MNYGSHRVEVRRDVIVPMRDGTKQYADIYLPVVGRASSSQRDPHGPDTFPAILERTPYSKDNSSEVQVDAPNFYASHGYAVVISDVRGRFKSEGKFYPFRDDGNDGYDTVEWIAAQSWCNGKVGTMGGSYSGVTQYQIGPTRPPHLTCMFCRESSADYMREWVFRGGAFELGFMWTWTVKWLLNSGRARGELGEQRIREIEAALASDDAGRAFLPDLRSLADEITRDCPTFRIPIAPNPLVYGHYDWYNEWLVRSDDVLLWSKMNVTPRHAEFDVPIFHLGGWFDIFQQGIFDNFLGIRKRARSPLARHAQRLRVGPWIHGPKQIGERVQGEVDFGEASALDFNELRQPWYDFWLRGIDHGIMNEPPVRLFVMGVNEWRDFEQWPPEDVRYTNWYFRASTSKNAESLNVGALALEAPKSREGPDSYEYDPLRPTPTIGGNTLNLPGGPRDQSGAEKATLTYTSEPLSEDLTIIGPVRCILYASSSSRDTDWVVKLCDVYPASPSRPVPASICICDGILRARYRESRVQPHLLEPGRVYRFEVDLWNTAHVFKEGHRIRVSVCSSNFPRFDRNLNTGVRLYFDQEWQAAMNTVYHDEQHPSCIVLPVMP